MPHRQLANISNSAENTNSRMVRIDKNCRKPTHLRLPLARQQPKCDKARWVISRVINVSTETPRLLESNIDDDMKLTVWPFMDKTWHWVWRLDRVWSDLWFLDCCTTSRVHVRLWEKIVKKFRQGCAIYGKILFRNFCASGRTAANIKKLHNCRRSTFREFLVCNSLKRSPNIWSLRLSRTGGTGSILPYIDYVWFN